MPTKLITHEEWFAMMDTDNDGVITPTDFITQNGTIQQSEHLFGNSLSLSREDFLKLMSAPGSRPFYMNCIDVGIEGGED